WPDELIGSLSHTTGWCGVALARRSTGLSSIGIDAERRVELSAGVIERVLTAPELADLDALRTPELAAVLRFSAKEAVYKALYPLLQRYIGFHEVEVWPDEDTATFEVRAVSEQLKREIREQPEMRGRYRQTDELCVTSFLVMA